jgi:hypothetical protein
MDSIKDLISQIRERGNVEESDINQSKLFDTSKLKTNPKQMMGDKHKYISKEYQLYGLRLANKLDDKKRSTMYIKWAKEKPRGILENALSFTVDYPNAKDKSRIFMWKVKELEEEYHKEKDKKKGEKEGDKKTTNRTKKLPL